MKRILVLFLATTMLLSCSSDDKLRQIGEMVKSGDIIFQSTNSRQCKAVKLATNSKYSHVGIIIEVDGQLMVYEAVQPVKKTPLNEWIQNGEGGHCVVKRLKNADKVLTDSVLVNMKEIGDGYLGKDYDIYFEWSDDKIYCSELVWKIYNHATGIEIGKLKNLEDFDLSSKLVKSIMSERYGSSIPLDEEVISPAGMFHSDKLEVVVKN